VLLSGDRSLLTDRLAAQMEDRLILRLADRDDYRLAGINPRDVAADMPPGRALRAESGIELQVAVLGAGGAALDPGGRAQAEAVRVIAADTATRWPPPRVHRPLRVDTMPTTISTAEVEAMAAAGRSELPDPRPAGSLWVTVGVGGDELTVRGVDLAATGGFVVAGPARSGRSSALVCLARSAAAAGAAVVAVCPRPSPLTAIEDLAQATVLSGGIPGPAEVLAAIEGSGGFVPTVLLVDDADTFAGSEADEAVRAVVRGEQQTRVAVVAAGPLEEMKTQLRGVIAEARRSRAGLLLSPSSSFDGDLVGMRLAASLVGRQPAGRGCLAGGGECLFVQVPLA
jgi:S-DNA-T family DNA segregation ATPase FtsK/SpoIIIE